MHIHQLNTLYESYLLKYQFGVNQGLRGQRVIFNKTTISPSGYTVWSYDLCIFISSIPSTKVIRSNFIWGHLGSQGSKGLFHQKCYNSSMLHSMTKRLIHIHKPEPLYPCYGATGQPGVIWVHMGQRSFSLKMLFSPSDHTVWSCDSCTTWYPLQKLSGQISLWVIWGYKGSKGHFHQKCYNSSILHSMTIKLIHVH